MLTNRKWYSIEIERRRLEILQEGRSPPGDEVHHYTSFDAACKILDTGTLRLSHALFLDDTSDIFYGLRVMEHAARKHQTKAVLNYVELMGQKLRDELRRGCVQPFVSCASIERTFSQWDRYSRRNGCCITFGTGLENTVWLKDEPPNRQHPTPGTVIYCPETQENVAKQLCHLLDEYTGSESEVEFQTEVLTTLLNGAVWLKNPNFAHEKE